MASLLGLDFLLGLLLVSWGCCYPGAFVSLLTDLLSVGWVCYLLVGAVVVPSVIVCLLLLPCWLAYLVWTMLGCCYLGLIALLAGLLGVGWVCYLLAGVVAVLRVVII